ncbi:NUDIX domain-containing protein [Thermopolyspora sp. NPDC052614]|uniref:NUDIX hydrolase n=1 Tax=Thermopolyspora sp. NPDC052614 TaxID=3155682 RepID=UPI00344536F7
MPEEATKPERPPVIAAIVTCERGVLVGRRHDGKPPWTFIAGEVEPGESIARLDVPASLNPHRRRREESQK